MPKDQKDKFNRVLKSTINGLSEFAGVLDDLGKQSTMMLKLLNKSIKELKGIKLQKGTVVVEEPKQAAKPILGIKSKTDAREKAASLLFNMLSTKPGSTAPSGAISATPTGPPSKGPPTGPPKRGPPKGPPPVSSGPPKGPPSKGPPKGPSGKPGLPPPPKLPPAAGSPPKGPKNIVKPPSIMRGPPGSSPPGSAPAASSPSPAAGGSSLGSLRDEMLKELDRLKKIMRGG